MFCCLSDDGSDGLASNMRMFGHRGASAVHPENTRAAFLAAMSKGALCAGVECDLHQLADSTIIVLHDETLRRTASCAQNVARDHILDTPVTELCWADVKDIDVGGWMGPEHAGERIHTLGSHFELLAEHGGAGLLELKGGDLAVVEPAAECAAA
eukprot:SAG11_NODE_10136_length_849_cov_1.371846_1_plen_154_part_10